MTNPDHALPSGPMGLRWALTVLVVAVVAGAAAVVAVWSVGAAVPGDAPSTPWTIGLATAIVCVVAGATWRRIDAAVVDLVFGVDDRQIAAIAAIEHDQAAQLGAARYLDELASITRSLLRVPLVRFDIRAVDRPAGADDVDGSSWSTQLTSTCGSSSTGDRLTRPVRLGSLDLGLITVGNRTRGRGFSADDVSAIDAIARQAALAISSARTAEALHASRRRAIAGIEDERRRLRRDLHDELGPNLAAMKLRLAGLRRGGDLSPAGMSLVDDLSALVDTTTAGVRRLVDDLRPPLLDELGLADAIRYLGFVPPELTFTVDSPCASDDLPAEVQVALYRIGSEAVRNVVRHAEASACTVRMRRHETAITMIIVDDGIGIAEGVPAGVGLAAMRERADELGGLVTVSAGADGRGCCVAATLPLQPPADPATSFGSHAEVSR